jgi:8-oxo-dGTP pyrophosphatase MutT (NUDIX family)
VPGGTIEVGETPEQAIMREVQEETGLVNFEIIEKIDEYQFYTEYSKKFIHRHVFHVEVTGNVPDTWTHRVVSNGKDRDLNFHFYWMDINDVGDQLVNRLGDSMTLLIEKLKNN